MKYSKDLKIKSVVININQLEALSDKLLELTKDDWGDLEWRRPKFEFENFQGETFAPENKDELIDIIKDNLQNISQLGMNYYGENVGFIFRFNNYGFSSNIYVTVESNDRSKMLLMKDEIERYLSNKSWNFLADKIIPLSLVAIFIGFIFVFKPIFKSLDEDIFKLITYLVLGIAFWLSFGISKHYPALVIEHDQEKSGRVFKKDVWLVVVLVILPLIINMVSNSI